MKKIKAVLILCHNRTENFLPGNVSRSLVFNHTAIHCER